MKKKGMRLICLISFWKWCDDMTETVSVEVLHEVVYSFIDEKMGKVTITQRVTQEQLASMLTDKNITLISVDKAPKTYNFRKKRKR